MSCYPLNGEVISTPRVGRWRPLVNWVLVVPSYVWMIVLTLGAAVVSFVAWLSIVFTGRMPESLGDYLVAVLRYQWRVLTYLYGLTECYPGFRVVAGYLDPGDYPAVFYSARPTDRRRVTVAFRAILVIPQIVVLYFFNVAAFVVLVIGWFAVLILGRWPQKPRSFVTDWMRWIFRVTGYLFLLVDQYPPLGLQV